MAVDQTTPLVGGPHPTSAPAVVHYVQDDMALAGREVDLPMTEGKYAKLVDPSMPLMLNNVMTRQEYQRQVEEINDLIHRTSEPYVSAIGTYVKVLYGLMFAMLGTFIVCFVLIFFTFGLSMIALFIIWFVLAIFSIVYRFSMTSKIKKMKREGDEKSRRGLGEISEKWAPRGIAWRQKEGQAQMMVSTRRRGMVFSIIRPLVMYIELAPNAGQLFRATQQQQQQPVGGYPQQPVGGYPQQQMGGYPQQQPMAYPPQQQQQQPMAGYPQQQPMAYPQQQTYPPQYPPEGTNAYPQQQASAPPTGDVNYV